MDAIREWLARIVSFVRRRARDEEFDHELSAHLDMLTDDNLRRGMSPEEARRAALVSLGGLEQTRELHRETRGLPLLDSLLQDARLAARSLCRTPGFTLTATLILALGMGANTTVFCALKAVLLSPPRFKDVDRLVILDLKRIRDGQQTGESPWWPTPAVDIVRASADRLVDPVANYRANRIILTGHGLSTEIEAEIVAPDYFSVLGLHAQLGRTFLPGENDPANSTRVAILAYEFWRSGFGGEPSAVGRNLVLNGKPYQVVGVAPKGFKGLTGRARLWVPTGAAGDFMRLSAIQRSHNHVWFLVGRLRPGVRLEEAQAWMRTVGGRIDAEYPFPSAANLHYVGGARSLEEAWWNPGARTSVLLLAASALLLLLVACADLSGLLIARHQSRSRDSAIRLALGASRWRLVRARLVECLMLSGLGGAAGLLLAHAGAGVLRAAWPGQFLDSPDGGLRVVDLGGMNVDASVMGYALATILAVATLVGHLPALRASRVDPVENMKAGLGGTRRRARYLGLDVSRCMVAVQVAMALVLVIGSGLVAKTVKHLLDVPAGFRTEDLLIFEYRTPREWPAEARTGFDDALMERIAALPGVAGLTRGCIPGRDFCSVSVVQDVEGRPEISPEERPELAVNAVDPRYFDILEIPILAGGGLDRRDDGSRPAAVLDVTAAHRLFPGMDPVGRIIQFADVRFEIVGVAARVLHGSPDHVPMPEAYVSNRVIPDAHGVILRTNVEPTTLAPAIRRTIAALSPDVVPANIATMEDLFDRATGDRRLIFSLLAAFSLVSVLLVAVGTWGIVARMVVDRRREFGVRIALGALGRQVVLPVLRQGMGAAVLGLGIGLILSWSATPVLEPFLYGTTSRDPATFVAGSVLLLAVVALASYLPVRRAMNMDPIEVLRSE